MSCELNFIWGQMRTAAWETASQVALRNCSKEAGGKVMWLWWRGSTCHQALIFPDVSISLMTLLLGTRRVVTVKDFSAFLDMKRNKNWTHTISSWKHPSEDLSCQFFPDHRAPHFCSPPWTPFRRCWKSAAAWFNPCRGSRQVPICSWRLLLNWNSKYFLGASEGFSKKAAELSLSHRVLSSGEQSRQTVSSFNWTHGKPSQLWRAMTMEKFLRGN